MPASSPTTSRRRCTNVRHQSCLTLFLSSTPERAVVPGVGQTAVDLRAGKDEATPLAQRDDLVHGCGSRLLHSSLLLNAPHSNRNRFGRLMHEREGHRPSRRISIRYPLRTPSVSVRPARPQSTVILVRFSRFGAVTGELPVDLRRRDADVTKNAAGHRAVRRHVSVHASRTSGGACAA